MTVVERKQVGQPEQYKGHTITVHFMGPDLLCRVDGQDVGGFWITSHHAIQGGKRHIDEILKVTA